jgi:hypothetical protein
MREGAASILLNEMRISNTMYTKELPWPLDERAEQSKADKKFVARGSLVWD